MVNVERLTYVSVSIEVMYALLVFICYRLWSKECTK